MAKRLRHGDHKSLSAQQMDCLGDSVRDAFTRHDMAAPHANGAALRQHYAKHVSQKGLARWVGHARVKIACRRFAGHSTQTTKPVSLIAHELGLAWHIIKRII